MTKYTDAQARAIKKYLSKQAEIKIRMMPFEKERVVNEARKAGQSISAYVIEAINDKIGRDEDGEPFPEGLILSLINWLKDHNITDGEIVDCLKTVAKGVGERAKYDNDR